jgi:hypothetical protein
VRDVMRDAASMVSGAELCETRVKWCSTNHTER